jgi:hypothetical protein
MLPCVVQEWLNTIFYRVWQFHEPLLCQKLRGNILQKLDKIKPSRVQASQKPSPHYSCGKNLRARWRSEI